MSIKEVFLENYVLIYELVGLLILLGVGVHLSDRMKRLTMIAILLIAVETVIFYVEKWTQTFETLSLLRPMMTASLYSIYPLILFFLTQITAKKPFSKKKTLLLLIPEFVCVPLFYSSQWTHLIFHYSMENHYGGGLLPGFSDLPYILFAFYIGVFLYHIIAYFKDASEWDIWLEIAYIVLVPIFGVMFFVLTESEKDYGSLFMSAILLYYIYVYVHMAKIDPLTSLLNRQSCYKSMQSNSKSITGVVSVDMNDLKYLNDTYGHKEGDKALRTIAGILREYCGKKGMAYRVGGDEFIILYKNAKETEIVDLILRMREKLSETDYSCAFGYSMILTGGTVKDAIRESDHKMYENKALIKSTKESAKADAEEQE